MNRVAAFASVAALFLVGVLIGGLGTYLFVSEPPHGPGPRGNRGDRFVEVLERELDLNADQMGRIEEILERGRAEGEALRGEILPRVRAVMDETRVLIRDILTPEQQLKFDELHEKNRERAERMFLGRGHRGRHPPLARQR